MSAIAITRSAVSTTLGSNRTRSRARTVTAIHRRPRSRKQNSPAGRPRADSHFGRDDLLPQFRELLFVFRPYLLFRDFLKSRDICFVDDHALGLEQFLGLGEIVDALGQLPNALLRGAPEFQQ